MRDLERSSRHITSTYLDLYAAQGAWRVEQVGKSVDDGFKSLLSAMFAGGGSPLKGYFLPTKLGGCKRKCEIVQGDNKPGTWPLLARKNVRRGARKLH